MRFMASGLRLLLALWFIGGCATMEVDNSSDTESTDGEETDTWPDECSDEDDCNGAPCVDGYCCDDPCEDLCRACNIEGSEGICTLYEQGEDPDNDCSQESPGTCGTVGHCDGAGACAYYGTETACDDNELCTIDDACDGDGTCVGTAPLECDPGPNDQCCSGACDSVDGCYTNEAGCTDVCGVNSLVVGQDCIGCGPANAEGICTGGSALACDAGTHLQCQEVTCGADTYLCTSVGGIWEWRLSPACDDGDSCTYNDACSGGACISTAYTCTSDTCMDRACDGFGACDETPINLGVACGTQACTSSDYCTGSGPSYSWWSYPSSCTQVCDAAGACVPCTCTVTETVCDVGPTDQCCDAVCSPSSGCSTVSGSCGLGDSCGTNILSLANTCTGCGVNLANGTCTAGTTTECSAASHSECQTVSCNATPYYCTNAGGIWEWRTTIPCDDVDVCTTGDSCNLVAEICEGTLISCLPGGGCCTEACDSLSGCETIPITGGCPDECLASGLTVGKSCQNCGPEGATGTCDAGTVHTCSVAQQCEQHICGGTTYYCTGVSGPWEWSNDPTCDDGISSTHNDTCLPTEVCQGAPDWMYRRDVIVDSNDTVAHTNYQVLVVLNSSFNYANAETNGEDVRFTTDSSGLTFDLDHYIESWNVSGESRLWFKLPSLPTMTSTTVYMFYGKAGEPDGQVTFASMFPSAYVSTGSTTLTGTNTYDWFELLAGHTVTVGAGQVLRISARRIIVGGNISGNAAGNSSSGTGGGSTTGGAGGGGYGGAGGQGGYDSGDSPGAGGSTHGSTSTATIDMGSKGGDTDSSVGGNGGGGVWLDASAITLGGNIAVNGTAGSSSGRCGGGGSGGGVLLVGDWLNGTGSISANGANGGSGTTANDGGGGGGGGRVKVFYDSTNALTGSVSSSAGSGGCCGDSDYGDPGSTGTDNQATATYKTSVTLGTETVM